MCYIFNLKVNFTFNLSTNLFKFYYFCSPLHKTCFSSCICTLSVNGCSTYLGRYLPILLCSSQIPTNLKPYSIRTSNATFLSIFFSPSHWKPRFSCGTHYRKKDLIFFSRRKPTTNYVNIICVLQTF